MRKFTSYQIALLSVLALISVSGLSRADDQGNQDSRDTKTTSSLPAAVAPEATPLAQSPAALKSAAQSSAQTDKKSSGFFGAFKKLNRHASGGDSSGGGDGLVAFRNEMERYVRENLKLRVQKLVEQELRLDEIADLSIQSLYEKLLEQHDPLRPDWKGLAQDIQDSRYVPGGPCFDTVIQPPERRGASALMNRPGTDICFDTNLLISQNVSVPVLVGLAIHEHAHHAGMNEADAQLMQAFVSARILDESSQNPDADALPFDQLSRTPITQLKSGDTLCVLSELRTQGSPFFYDGMMSDGIPSNPPNGVYCYLSPFDYHLHTDVMGIQHFPAGAIKIQSILGPFKRDGQALAEYGMLIENYGQLMCERNPETGPVPTVAEVLRALRGNIEPKAKGQSCR